MLSIWITYRWGIEAMLWGQILLSFLGYYLNTYFTDRLLGYTLVDQVKSVFPYLCAAFAMGLVISASKLLFEESGVLSLLTGSIFGILSYYFICKSFRLAAFEEVTSLFKERFDILLRKRKYRTT